MKIKISKATSKDAKGVAKVLTESYNIKSEKEGIGVFKSETKKGNHYIVAKEGKEIIGIVTWLSHGLPKHGLCELDRIAVLSQWRGKGVSKRLKDAMIDDAKRWYKKQGSVLRKLYLLTHEDNERARRFYEKMGFGHETTLKDHYYRGKGECVYSVFF
jgi:ribosomal protein S18 acetylase RimI-like enzyme